MTKSNKRNNSPKCKRKLTLEQKARKKNYKTVFINGKQKRVLRERMIDGIQESEFISRNADPVWALENGHYELLGEMEGESVTQYPTQPSIDSKSTEEYEDEFPF